MCYIKLLINSKHFVSWACMDIVVIVWACVCIFVSEFVRACTCVFLSLGRLLKQAQALQMKESHPRKQQQQQPRERKRARKKSAMRSAASSQVSMYMLACMLVCVYSHMYEYIDKGKHVSIHYHTKAHIFVQMLSRSACVYVSKLLIYIYICVQKYVYVYVNT